MDEISQEQVEQINALKKKIMLTILSKDAYERLGRVRIANPTLAEQLETYLIQLYQTGQLRETITDEKLKEILNLLTQKREFKIIRK